MMSRRVYRLLIAIYSIHVIASTKCVSLVWESAEISHGKPITASSTCGANEMYCFIRGKNGESFICMTLFSVCAALGKVARDSFRFSFKVLV